MSTLDAFLDKIRGAAADPGRALGLSMEHLGADTGTLHRLEPDGLLHLEASAGPIPEPLLEIIQRIPVGKGIAGLAVERKEPVDMCNLQTDTSGRARPRARETGVKGSLCVPMMSGDQVVGALGVGTHEEREFNEDETALLLEVGRILAERASGGS